MKGKLLGVLLFLPALSVWGWLKPLYNYYNFTFGTRALSLGNAFTAVADDLSAVYWNPAGISRLRLPEFYLSYKSSSQQQDYETQELKYKDFQQTYDSHFQSALHQIDFFAISVPARFWNCNWGFALSYYRLVPYGFKSEENTTLVSTDPEVSSKDTSLKLHGSDGIDVLGFSTAVSISEFFSLGLTLQQFFNTGDMQIDFTSDRLNFSRQFSEKILGRSLIAGLLFQPVEYVDIGFTYHFKLKDNFSASYEFTEFDETGKPIKERADSCLADVETAPQFSIGLQVKPVESLRITGEFSKLYWANQTISNYYDSKEALPFPVKDDFTFAQQDIVNFRLGAEWRIHIKKMFWSLRGGLFSDRQLYVDNHDVPVKVKGYSLGLGVELSDYFTADVAYQRQKADWTENGFFSNSDDALTHFHAHVFQLSLTYRFHRLQAGAN
jgi:long-subunit fatty acid transport protein